jgi:hypothetical protein
MNFGAPFTQIELVLDDLTDFRSMILSSHLQR